MMPSSILLRWYKKHGRKLPWRNTRDPYKILVSEIMLQQTQVERVKTKYKEWMKQFPNFKTLSEASNATVIHAWAGLGYNKRALMLRDIARQIEHLGIPQTREHWMQLKGVGPYTSAALTAFSLQQRVIPIDTNIRRVLGRYILGTPYPQLSDDEKLEERTDSFLQKRGAYHDVPQAIFDLATSICTKTPDCKSCPLKRTCKSSKKFLSGKVATPARMTKKANERIHSDKKYPDRIYRGRILQLAREHKKGIGISKVGTLIDPTFDLHADHHWLVAMIDRMEKDHLIFTKDKKIHV